MVVFWDLAGNAWEWTSGQVSFAVQPGVVGNYYSSWLEWINVTIPGALSVDSSPAGTGIVGASSWANVNGIGQLFSNPSDTVLRGFVRGGNWSHTNLAGVLCLFLGDAPSFTLNAVGLRVTAPAF